MPRFAVAMLSMLLLALTASAADAPACGELGCRANGLGYVSPEGGVVIMPGESFSIALKIEGDKITGFEPRKLSRDLPNSIELNFMPGMLKLSSHVGRMVRADGFMKLEDGRLVHTSLCPLMANLGGYESWNDPIVYLELRNLRFEDSQSMVCK